MQSKTRHTRIFYGFVIKIFSISFYRRAEYSKRKTWERFSIFLIINFSVTVICDFIIYNSTNFTTYESLLEVTLIQRFTPQTVTHPVTREYMRVVGLIEIIIKSATLLLSIGTTIVIRRRLEDYISPNKIFKRSAFEM